MQPATAPTPPLSQSRQALMACPIMYHERIILGKEEAPNPYAERGTQIHARLAAYVQHLAESKQASDYAYLDELIASVSGEVLDILEKAKEVISIDPDKILFAEEYLALDDSLAPVNDAERQTRADIAYEGTLDLVLVTGPRSVEIWDWKSYYQIIDADTFQSKLYPLLIFKHFPGFDRVTFRLQFVRYGVSRDVTYTRDEVPALERLVRSERARQIHLHGPSQAGLDGEYAAMPGAHCCYCPRLMRGCPIAEINPYSRRSGQTPEDRVRFGVWLQAASRENTRILKDLVAAGGPIGYADANQTRYEAQFKLTARASYPLTCYDQIEHADPDLIPKLTISGLSSPLKAKKRAALRAALEPLKVEKAQTRFVIGAGDEEEEE